MTTKRPPTRERVYDWLKAGNTGTPSEIARALGVTYASAYAALVQLEGLEMAVRDGTKNPIRDDGTVSSQTADVWRVGERRDEPSGPTIVQQAIASRHYLLTCWMSS